MPSGRHVPAGEEKNIPYHTTQDKKYEMQELAIPIIKKSTVRCENLFRDMSAPAVVPARMSVPSTQRITDNAVLPE